MENALNKILLAAILATTAATPVLAKPDLQQINNQVYALPDPADWAEGKFELPPYPQQADWIGFYVPLKSDYSYFVDGKTLTKSDEDGVIRLILRMVSAKGAENISYEGIHCGNRSLRSYAFGDSFNHQWIQSSRAMWKRITINDKVRLRLAEDLCPDWDTPKTSADALERLKKAPWR